MRLITFDTGSDTMDVALRDVWLERRRQDSKWGVQSHSPLEWLAILAEEFGEVSTEVNEMHFRGKDSSNYRAELVQVAAVAINAIENLDRIVAGERDRIIAWAIQDEREG